MKGPFEEEGVDHRFLAGPFLMFPVGRRCHPTDRGEERSGESYLVRRGLGWCTNGSSARLNRFAFRSKS